MTPRCHDGCVYACRVAETVPPREACDDPELVALVAALEACECCGLGGCDGACHDDSPSEHERRAGEERAEREYARMHGVTL